MNYRFIRGPFMLMETTQMLFKYVNNFSFSDTLYKLKSRMGGKVPEKRVRVLQRLQQIMGQLCEELDPQDPVLQQFFLKEERDPGLCLAVAMVVTFEDLGNTDIWQSAQTMREQWRALQENGYWIRPETGGLLYVTEEPGCPGDLFTQIRNMDLSPEFKLTLYDGLRNFDETMDKLLELVAPLAQKLERIYEEESWLFEVVEEDWAEFFATTPPEDFLGQFCEGGHPWDRNKELRIAISMMYADRIVFSDSRFVHDDQDYELLYIGCGMPSKGLTVNAAKSELDHISATLKFLSDRKRLEILQRLDQKASYCSELAVLLGMDVGNMSRALSQLHSRGFLCQEWRDSRLYYRTERDSVCSFFRMAEKTVFKDS